MKYSECMAFAPIETVIQLREADDRRQGLRLVEEYVIGDEMADRLLGSIFPALDPTERAGRGLLVIGNYGTGKSHLLAVLSSVAESAEARHSLAHPAVAAGAEVIAGRFFVVRSELGATTMSLRDFICGELEEYLKHHGVQFNFPRADQVGGHKELFEELLPALMAGASKDGLLLVVDELLDYLRTRSDRELAYDLSFLRELGEVARIMPFRFIAGVQEGLFGNPRFQFVAEGLKRVEDRFEEVRITGGDLRQVVAERLLPRSDQQAKAIGLHLKRFAGYFPNLAGDLALHSRLFPVHPAYLETLGKLNHVEKREVLRTISSSISRVLDREVSLDDPGVLSYDDFWQFASSGGHRARPGRRAIIDAVATAEDRLASALTRPAQKDAVRRILRALAVKCLQGGQHESGVSNEQLRDELFLFAECVAELGGPPADDLLSFVDSTIVAMRKALAGQFITSTADGRVFLDLKRTEDFEAVLVERTESIGSDEADRALLTSLLEILVPPRPGGDAGCSVPWPGHGRSRRVPISCGLPESHMEQAGIRVILLASREAPRRQAPGDIFIIPPLNTELDGLFRRAAAASELAASATGESRVAYTNAARDALYLAANKLKLELRSGARIGRADKIKTVSEWIEGEDVRTLLALGPLERAGPRELVLLCAGLAARSTWESESSDYPRFSRMIGAESLTAACRDAVREILGDRVSDAGHTVLEGLDLMTGELLTPLSSRYARALITSLARQPHGQVLNRSTILDRTTKGEQFEPHRFGLEPELVAVLCTALVKTGIASIWVQEQLLGADDLPALADVPFVKLLRFRCLVPPPVWAVEILSALFDAGVEHQDWDHSAADYAEVSIGAAIEQLLPTGSGRESGSLSGALQFREPPDNPKPDLLAYLSHAEACLPAGHPWRTALTAARREIGASVVGGSAPAGAAPLLALKRSYIRLYRRLHGHARLNADGDAAKSALIADRRLSVLAAFSGTETFPEQKFRVLQDEVMKIRSCYGLRTEQLELSPTCPFCKFTPRIEVSAPCAATRISAASRTLDVLYDSWIARLRSALGTECARSGLRLLPEHQRVQVDRFTATGELPHPLRDSLVGAVRDLIRGLVPVELAADLVRDRLRGESPGSPDEVRRRFDVLLHEALRGQRPDRVRILVV